MAEACGQSQGAAVSGRWVSVDALRGFDMFWIVGAGTVVHSLKEVSTHPAVMFFVNQVSHKEWEGFAFEDLIFPLFLFIVGVSLVFSLGKIVEREGKAMAYKRLLRRSALMLLFGIFYYGAFANSWPDIRLVGVLQRLAFGYLFAGLLFLNLRTRGLIAVCVGLLLGYWVLLTFVPVPDVGATTFEMGKNWACYIDKMYLPGKRIYGDGTWDPEGLLSTFPAIATCLLGVFGGQLLQYPGVCEKRKTLWLIGGGAVMVLLGFLWGLQFPVIKKIWTSSYVLVAGGYSYMLLGAFFLVVDVWQYRAWARPFLWIGSNAITVYMAVNLIDFEAIATRFVGGDIKHALGCFGNFGVASVRLALVILLVRYLYHKRIFLRL